MRFAQISDIHVPDFEGVTARDFMNKRITGALNLLTGRRGSHPVDLAERLIADVSDQHLDHVMVTGDITNLSLPGEFQRVSRLLRLLGGYDNLTVIPGNHDVYTRGSERQGRFLSYFGDVLFKDDTPTSKRTFPAIKDLGPVTVCALSSAVPTLPFLAYGKVSATQLDEMVEALSTPAREKQFKVALVHHNLAPQKSAFKQWSSRLQNADAVIDRCFQAGVDLLLHGHTHLANNFTITRDGHTLTITGSGSSTQFTSNPALVARYNITTVTGRTHKVRTRVYDRHERRFTWLV